MRKKNTIEKNNDMKKRDDIDIINIILFYVREILYSLKPAIDNILNKEEIDMYRTFQDVGDLFDKLSNKCEEAGYINSLENLEN